MEKLTVEVDTKGKFSGKVYVFYVVWFNEIGFLYACFISKVKFS